MPLTTAQGMLQLKWKPEKAGDYKVVEHATHGDSHVPIQGHEDVVLTVKPGRLETLNGPIDPPQNARAGEELCLAFIAEDMHGNRTTDIGDTVRMSWMLSGYPQPLVACSRRSTQPDGTVHLHCTPRLAGTYTATTTVCVDASMRERRVQLIGASSSGIVVAAGLVCTSQEHVEVIAGDKAQWALAVTDDRGRCVNDCDQSFRVQLQVQGQRTAVVEKELRMEGGRLLFECDCTKAGSYNLVTMHDEQVVGLATVNPGPLHTFMVVETEAMENTDKGTTDRWLEVRLRSLDAYGNPCPCPEGCDLHLEAAAIFSPNALRGATEGDFFCRRPLVPKSGKNPLFSARLEWDAKPSGVGKVHEYVLGCVMMNGKMMPLSFATGESPVVEKAIKVQQGILQKAVRAGQHAIYGSGRWHV